MTKKELKRFLKNEKLRNKFLVKANDILINQIQELGHIIIDLKHPKTKPEEGNNAKK